jgi:hypothetical protein
MHDAERRKTIGADLLPPDLQFVDELSVDTTPDCNAAVDQKSR